MIAGEYEQRVVCKHYNVVGNDPNSVLGTFGVMYRVNYQVQQVYMDVINHILFVPSRLVPVIATVLKHTYVAQEPP